MATRLALIHIIGGLIFFCTKKSKMTAIESTVKPSAHRSVRALSGAELLDDFVGSKLDFLTPLTFLPWL